jgi:hypothetical protein
MRNKRIQKERGRPATWQPSTEYQIGQIIYVTHTPFWQWALNITSKLRLWAERGAHMSSIRRVTRTGTSGE